MTARVRTGKQHSIRVQAGGGVTCWWATHLLVERPMGELFWADRQMGERAGRGAGRNSSRPVARSSRRAGQVIWLCCMFPHQESGGAWVQGDERVGRREGGVASGVVHGRASTGSNK